MTLIIKQLCSCSLPLCLFIVITPGVSPCKLTLKPGNNYHFNTCSHNCYSSTYSIIYSVGMTPAARAPDQSSMSALILPGQQALIRSLVKASYLPGLGPFTTALLQAPGA